MKKRQGFTLIETSVAVAVVGLLASLSIPSFKIARNRSIRKAKITNVRILNQAAHIWATEKLVPDGTPITLDIADYINGGLEQLNIGELRVIVTNITQKTVGYTFTVEDIY